MNKHHSRRASRFCAALFFYLSPPYTTALSHNGCSATKNPYESAIKAQKAMRALAAFECTSTHAINQLPYAKNARPAKAKGAGCLIGAFAQGAPDLQSLISRVGKRRVIIQTAKSAKRIPHREAFFCVITISIAVFSLEFPCAPPPPLREEIKKLPAFDREICVSGF